MDAKLDNIIKHQQLLLTQSLRREYPFLQDHALQKILRNIDHDIRDGMQEQAPVIAKTKANFNFFSLPTELRNHIYELAVVAPDTICVQQSTLDPLSYNDHQRLNLGNTTPTQAPMAFRVCRQMRQETLPIFFGQNSFVVYTESNNFSPWRSRALRAWLKLVGKKNASFIKQLIIRVPLIDGKCSWLRTTGSEDPYRVVESRLDWNSLGVALEIIKLEFGTTVEQDIQAAMLDSPADTSLDSGPLVQWTPMVRAAEERSC